VNWTSELKVEALTPPSVTISESSIRVIGDERIARVQPSASANVPPVFDANLTPD